MGLQIAAILSGTMCSALAIEINSEKKSCLSTGLCKSKGKTVF